MPNTGKINHNGETAEGTPDPALVREIGLLRALLETRLNGMDKSIDNLSALNINLPQDVRVLQSEIKAVQLDFDRRINSQEKNVGIALIAADKTTAIAQATADKAVVKAEAAASREYLEAQITALSNVTTANQHAQKEAINAALVASEKALTAALAAAKEALIAALASSEKAITKAEEATEKRFTSLDEARGNLGDQQQLLATKSEVQLRFSGVDDKFKAVEDKLATALSTLDVTRGKSEGVNWAWGIFLAVATLVISGAVFILAK